MNRLELREDVSQCERRRQASEWTYVILCQEVEGTEELVVVEFEALRGLHALEVLRVRRRLGCDLLDVALRLELPVRILRGDSRAPPAATVVAVRVVRRMRRDGRIVRHAVVVLVRHSCGDGFFVLVMEERRLCDVCALCVGGAEDGRKLANNKALASGWFRRWWRVGEAVVETQGVECLERRLVVCMECGCWMEGNAEVAVLYEGNGMGSREVGEKANGDGAGCGSR